MANTAPEAMQEVEQLKKTISQSSLNTAYAAMTKQATDPATTEKMVQEIQDLFGRTIAMGESFERVKIELGRVDANGYKDQDGKPLERLQSTWIGFQNVSYYSVLRTALSKHSIAIYSLDVGFTGRSHRHSISIARSFIPFILRLRIEHPSRFCRGALPDTQRHNCSARRKEERFGRIHPRKSSFISFFAALTPSYEHQGNKSTVRSQTQTFATLHRDIQAFATKCIAFVDAQNVELAAKIKTLTGEISALTKDIEA